MYEFTVHLNLAAIGIQTAFSAAALLVGILIGRRTKDNDND